MDIIAHLDMNSYFASCHQQLKPALRHKPIGVCEHLGGIIIAPSIEAKAMGVKTAMPVWEAKKLCPQIILERTKSGIYSEFTRKWLKIILDFDPHANLLSIDEACLNLTRITNVVKLNSENKLTEVDPWQEAALVARTIKQKIKKEVGEYLRCSIGIAENQLVAKIASDLQKPNGLVVVRPEDKASLYDKLKLQDVPGTGFRMEKRLNRLGIFSLKALRDFPQAELVSRFGLPGHFLYELGQLEGGRGNSFFSHSPTMKSVGHIYTFPRNQRKIDYFWPIWSRLSEMVCRRLRKKQLVGQVLHVGYRGLGGEKFYESRCFYSFTNQPIEILKWVKIMLRHHQSIPLVRASMTVSFLVEENNQGELFVNRHKWKSLFKALDKINDKYGGNTSQVMESFKAGNLLRESIGFGRIREL